MKHSITIGSTFSTTRDGIVEVIADKGFGVFTVKFLNTGFERDTRRHQLITGRIKDKSLQPTTRKVTTPKFHVVLNDGTEFDVVKLVDVLDFIEDKNVGKLYNLKCGRTAHAEVASIADL